MKLNSLHLWFKRKKEENTSVYIIKPVPASVTGMKIEVAKTLQKLGMKSIEYYYVVAEANLGKGRRGYRTVVGKVVVG